MRQPRVLFPIAVDPVALSDHPTDRDLLVHRVVVVTIGDHGILTLSKADEETLYRAIAGLGDRSKELWVERLESLYDLNRLDWIPDAMRIGDRLRQDGNIAESLGDICVVVASRAVAEEHGFNDNVGFAQCGDLEIVTPSTIDQAPTVVAVDGTTRFPKGKARRSEVASSFLRPLAERSSAVKLLDPHILEGVINSKNKKHAEWLVQTLSEAMPAGATLSILGKLQRDWQTTDRARGESLIEDFLSKALHNRTSPMAIKVRLLKHTDLRNRYVWFSTGHSFDVLHNF